MARGSHVGPMLWKVKRADAPYVPSRSADTPFGAGCCV